VSHIALAAGAKGTIGDHFETPTQNVDAQVARNSTKGSNVLR
jgi:hypothetical protein